MTQTTLGYFGPEIARGVPSQESVGLVSFADENSLEMTEGLERLLGKVVLGKILGVGF